MDAFQRLIEQHIVDRLNATMACGEPFAHLYVQGLLPADIYAELVASRPDPRHYLQTARRHRRADGQFNRLRLPLTDDGLDRLTGSQLLLWRALRDALCSQRVKRALFHALRDGLGSRYSLAASAAASIPGYPAPTLFRETTGYCIAPHPDTRKKIVTLQLALPADATQVDLGTALYRRSFALQDWLRRPRGFAKARQFPFLPNSAYAFVVLNRWGRKKSWHGREELGQQAGVRHSLLSVYGAEPADGFPVLGEVDERPEQPASAAANAA